MVGFFGCSCLLECHCLLSAFEASSGSHRRCDLSELACSAYAVIDVTHLPFAHFESCRTPMHCVASRTLCSEYCNHCMWVEWQKQWSTSILCLSFLPTCLLTCMRHYPISLHFAKCKFKNKIKNSKKATRALNQAEALKSMGLCVMAPDWLCILFLLRVDVRLCCVLSNISHTLL